MSISLFDLDLPTCRISLTRDAKVHKQTVYQTPPHQSTDCNFLGVTKISPESIFHTLADNNSYINYLFSFSNIYETFSQLKFVQYLCDTLSELPISYSFVLNLAHELTFLPIDQIGPECVFRLFTEHEVITSSPMFGAEFGVSTYVSEHSCTRKDKEIEKRFASGVNMLPNARMNRDVTEYHFSDFPFFTECINDVCKPGLNEDLSSSSQTVIPTSVFGDLPALTTHHSANETKDRYRSTTVLETLFPTSSFYRDSSININRYLHNRSVNGRIDDSRKFRVTLEKLRYRPKPSAVNSHGTWQFRIATLGRDEYAQYRTMGFKRLIGYRRLRPP